MNWEILPMRSALILTLACLGLPGIASAQNPYENPLFTTNDKVWGYVSTGAFTTRDRFIKSIAVSARDYGRALNLLEEARTKMLENRKLALEQWKWELEFGPGIVDVEKRRRSDREGVMKIAPTPSEIVSGRAINILMDEIIRAKDEASLLSYDAPISRDFLNRIQFSVGQASFNVSFLQGWQRNKDEFWPWQLRHPALKPEIEKMNGYLEKCLLRAQLGSMDPDAIYDLDRYIPVVTDKVRSLKYDTKRRISPTEATMAFVFLGKLQDNLELLMRPDAKDYFSASPLISDNMTVGKFILELKTRGLRLGPAQQGGETAYHALYNQIRQISLQLSGTN
jgi:hypothetical protein